MDRREFGEVKASMPETPPAGDTNATRDFDATSNLKAPQQAVNTSNHTDFWVIAKVS